MYFCIYLSTVCTRCIVPPPWLTACLPPSLPGIKRIMPDQMSTSGPVLGGERSSEEFFDSLDHVIDIHGHIIGMGLSPDHRWSEGPSVSGGCRCSMSHMLIEYKDSIT